MEKNIFQINYFSGILWESWKNFFAVKTYFYLPQKPNFCGKFNFRGNTIALEYRKNFSGRTVAASLFKFILKVCVGRRVGHP